MRRRKGRLHRQRFQQDIVEGKNQLTDLLQGHSGITVEESVVADLHEPGGQDMLKESPDELEGVEGHGTPLVGIGIFVSESD